MSYTFKHNLKPLLAVLLLLTFISKVSAQSSAATFKTSPSLLSLRKTLATEDSLMNKGILQDTDTKKLYFTGYAYKTLYDWDQYFESIVQIYMGRP